MKATTHTTLVGHPTDNKVFNLVSSGLTLSNESKVTCLELLQESLDLKDLLTNFASIVARIIRPFNVRFQSANGLFSLNNHEKYHFSNTYNLPLSSKCPRIGSITYQSNQPLSMAESKQLIELHELLVPNLRHALKFAELNALVFKDHLTNVGNRAYYDESLQRAIEQSSRGHQSLSLMVFDINDFKPINDQFGHLKGDKVLQQFAAILTKIIRSSDMAFRLGGDEFVLILQPGDQHSVNKISERLLVEIQHTPFLTELNFSASMGYAHWQMGEDAKVLFENADKKLYIEKANK
ncbi:GGDEF domain-containing protein [Psychromonas sp. psych-6C06]|uniref:GGDEF domain-containing protein n=1 Tax=Psychromonas sp. psych-6C06 TaxID=2058089 RepID=UPI000C343FD3|nr:GGDEF domain-containing protein [Psychromonas sp. psych-6C06]PKF62865.1 GGDEF domain-containing protein [Psychromonas sp. psych-6C06]